MVEYIHSIPNSPLYATAKMSLSGEIWIGMSPQTDIYLGVHYTFRTHDIPSVLAVKNNRNCQPSESVCVDILVAIKLC